MNASKIAISLTLAAAVTSMAAPNENAKPRVIVSPPAYRKSITAKATWVTPTLCPPRRAPKSSPN